MSRKLLLLGWIVLFSASLAFAAPARKAGGGDRGTTVQAPKQSVEPRAKPDRHPVSTTTQTPSRPPGGGGRPPSTRPPSGNTDPGVIHNSGGSVPNRPGSFLPHHNGSGLSTTPYTRPNWPDYHYSYPDPGRAYGHRPPPPPPAPRHDSYWWGGWGWGPRWSVGFGYVSPWPNEVYVPYPVPGPTVYYPVPTPEVVTVPTPVPAETAPAATPAPNPADLPLLGCDIVAGDGKFIGTIDREYDSPQSIANRNSDFGNPASELSLWNPKSLYGSPTSDYSPWNPKAKYPPMLSWHGAFKGYLTTNPEVTPAISPEVLSTTIQASPWR